MLRYGLEWNQTPPLMIEQAMIRAGGKMVIDGKEYGEGIFHHYKEAMSIQWPWFQWHRWSDLLIKHFSEQDEIGVMGPASSGKTFCSAAYALTTYWAWLGKGTSILMSTTTVPGLDLRVWGAIKELYNRGKERHEWLPGHILESRKMLVTQVDDEEAVDFRDGIIGIACKVGGQFVGITNYVGIKNERVILIADESSLMPRTFLDSIANLRKNPRFQLIAMGNPKDRNDALGEVCCPPAGDGGYDGLPYAEETRTWKTRARGGVGIQICGYDSPNFDYPRGVNPFRGLITPEQIDNDLEYYGRQSLQFSMMNLGVLPRDGGNRRVITLTLCEQFGAFDRALFASQDKNVLVAGLDAAYSGVGGDRCVLTFGRFGPGLDQTPILEVTEQVLVPVDPGKKSSGTPEQQIARWVKTACEARGVQPANFGFDATGRGGLGVAFAQEWSNWIVPIEFGGLPSDERTVSDNDKRKEREAYGKQVTALWYSTRLGIECSQVRGLPRECAQEGALREWTISRAGKIDVEPKEKTKERMGRSPDLYDSFATMFEMARRRGFALVKAGNRNQTRSETPDWLKRLRDKAAELNKRKSLEYK